MDKKIYLISLVVATLLAGIVSFYSCKNDNELTPAEDGKNLAQELCDCFTKAGNDDAKLTCISNFESKRDKWRDEADAKEFETAFEQAITSCVNDPYQWKLSYTAVIAASEFCALAAQYPDGGDMTILAPLYMKYEAELNSENPAFLEPFFGGLIACSPASNWILCTFRMTDFCPKEELTDEELADLAATAAPEFCRYFAENPTADINSMLTSGLAKYANYFSKPAFIGALLQGLGSCSSTPQWFICMMTGNAAPGCN
jgi:hypothetical protein